MLVNTREAESPRVRPKETARTSVFRVAAISGIVLVPCFWQRIQAGDFGSHLYNAWLGRQVELGTTTGLTLAAMRTNILFDLILSWLMEHFGLEATQRIAVSLAALVFFWGAFAFVSAVNRSRPWFMAPCLAMLTYGWTFHMGFFNFYLALGLSLWAMALLLGGSMVGRASGLGLLALACVGHVLPPLWALAVLAYKQAAERLPRPWRLVLLALALGAIAGLKFWIGSHYSTKTSFHQYLEAVAVDQVWVFGLKYCAICIGVAVLWGFMLLRASHVLGSAGLFFHPLFQLCAVMSAGILMLPSSIELPGHAMALSFITERMTLAYATLICAFLAGAQPERWQQILFLPVAALYFSFIYTDTRAINRVEDRMEALVKPLSLNDRVFSSFEDPMSRVQLWGHNLDRVCVGKCLSYGNYEPFTQLFRVRTVSDNPWVVASPADFGGLSEGGYHVKPRDLPLYQITFCADRSGEFCLLQLKAEDVTRHDQLSVTPLLW